MVRLPDGTPIEIEPIGPGDREALVTAMQEMSPVSRYQRFLSPAVKLSSHELDYLTRVDHHDHEALVARHAETSEGLGLARYVRSARQPDIAEVAVAVDDDWHRRGVGTVLLGALRDRAREAGIDRFSALALSDNHAVLGLLAKLGPVEVKRHEGNTVELEIDLD